MNKTLLRWSCLAAALGLSLGSTTIALAQTFIDINPDLSDLDPFDPDGASGGRVNGLAAVAGDNTTFYAATEWGGIYKSTDVGLTWTVLSGHRPMATWDVEVDPGNTNIVYATSFFDGRTQSIAGINVSRDAGLTWTHPPTANPPPGLSCFNVTTEPSAFGISIRRDASNNVYIGTHCGLAVSHDSGATWTFVDPTPNTPASRVWDVIVQPGGASNQGVVDICGDDGNFHSIDGGTTWTAGVGLPQGRCSIAASPDEQYVLLVAAADNNLYESDDAGATWTNLGSPDVARQGRIPFVETNQRSNDALGNRFDAWYGDVSLERGECVTPAVPAMGGAPRCPAAGSPQWIGFFTRGAGGHDDVGSIVFDSEVAVDACPVLFSSDGGVYWNTDRSTPTCHNPSWQQPNVTPHALWFFGFEGVHVDGLVPEDLYFGNQDNGSWGTTTAGALNPAWHNEQCCDGFSIAADPDRVLYVLGFFGFGRGFRLFTAAPGMVGTSEINNYPPDGLLPAFAFDESIARWGDNNYVLLTNDCSPGFSGCPGTNGGDGGVFITTDITANPIVWTELGNATEPPSFNIVGVQVGVDAGGTPTFYVRAGDGDRRGGGSLWKFVGTDPNGVWEEVDTNDGLSGGFNAYAVAPSDPNLLYASNITPTGPEIVFSDDGGTTWNRDLDLENLMSGGGAFELTTLQGPTNFTGFGGYPQPSMFAFDQLDPNIIVAGAVDAGVFISMDGGANWALLTDPLTSNTSGIPHLPRPHYAYFDHDAGSVHVFVGTQGRGVWRIELVPQQPPVAVCQDVTVAADENCEATVTADQINNGSFVPGGPPPTCTLNTTGPFGLGPHTVTLTCVNTSGQTDSCTATVTVVDESPPVFTSVPPDLTTTTCVAPNIGTATAVDNCTAVTITNNAPARFPLGTTIVTWTARDAFGNVSTATQRVTVELGDNSACCPAGTRIIVGTPNNDLLTGTNGSDCILGRGGQDTINGLGGNDFISGGDGNDTINAGDGNDMVFGGPGQDSLVGGSGDDTMFGDDGDDTLQGGIGNDTLHGGQGQDILLGQDGNDLLEGEVGDDNLQGGNGNDILAGGPNNDTCNGGAGVNIFEQCEFGAPNSCADTVLDGTETAVDCGGGCPGCPAGDACISGGDCLSTICSGGICEAGGSAGLVQATLQVTTDWGAGYCVGLSVTNNNIVSTTNWSVNVNIPGATTYTTWNGVFSGNTGAVSIGPVADWNRIIPGGATNTSVGFCANRAVPGSGLLPSVVSTTGTF